MGLSIDSAVILFGHFKGDRVSRIAGTICRESVFTHIESLNTLLYMNPRGQPVHEQKFSRKRRNGYG